MSVVPVAVELFGLSAVVERLVVDHVDVEEEGKVVVCVWVLVVHQDALLQVLHCVLVVADLEVRQPQVILQLSVVVVDALGLLEGRDCEHVLALLEHSDPVVKERLPAARVALLQVFFRLNGQTLPVLGIEQVETALFKDDFFFKVEFCLALRTGTVGVACAFQHRWRALVVPVSIVIARFCLADNISVFVGASATRDAKFACEDVRPLLRYSALILLLAAVVRASPWVLNQLLHIEVAQDALSFLHFLAAAKRLVAAPVHVVVVEVELVFLQCLVDLIGAVCAQRVALLVAEYAVRGVVFRKLLLSRTLNKASFSETVADSLIETLPAFANCVGSISLEIHSFLHSLEGKLRHWRLTIKFLVFRGNDVSLVFTVSHDKVSSA